MGHYDDCRYEDAFKGMEQEEQVPKKPVSGLRQDGIQSVKPPLGLMPKAIFYRNRALEILGAMERYVRADKKIPLEWLDELEDLIGEP